MPVAQRMITPQRKTLVRKAPVAKPEEKKKYTIPMSPIEPLTDLGAYSWLIFGAKKIGKSTLAATFPDSLFFMFEPGGKALRIRRMDCDRWEDALGYVTSLEKLPKDQLPKTVVLDTGFEAALKASNYVCKQLKIDYPREDNFGKDWAKIKLEVREFHDRLFALHIGMVVLCHETVKEHQTYTGQKYDKVVPLLPKGSDELYRAVIDNVAWYHYRGHERFLQIRGTDHAMAGVALQADEFFKTKSGEPIFAIHIPNDPKGGYNAIVKAFKNQVERSFKDETEKFSERAVKDSVNEKIRKESKKRR